METVWKFPVKIGHTFVLDLPARSVVLHVATQHDRPCLWVRLDPEAPTQTQRYIVVPTGGDVDPAWVFVSTFFTLGGVFVWHLFRIVD